MRRILLVTATVAVAAAVGDSARGAPVPASPQAVPVAAVPTIANGLGGPITFVPARAPAVVDSAMPAPQAGDTRLQNVHLGPDVDSIAATDTNTGTRSWYPYIYNPGPDPVPSPEISIDGADPGWTWAPPVSFPIDVTGADIPAAQSWGISNLLTSQAQGVSITTGYDGSRSISPVSIPPGGADQTVTLTITPTDSAYTGGAEILEVFVPDAASTIDTSSVSTSAFAHSEFGTPTVTTSYVIWIVNNAYAGATYTLSLTMHVDNTTGAAFDHKPAVTLQANHSQVDVQPTGTSTSIDDGVLGGTITYSTSVTSSWLTLLNDEIATYLQSIPAPSGPPPPPVTHPPADFDGNGTTDISVYRPLTGQWFVRGQFTTSWGEAGDMPVPGDYDGNGTTDVAVFRPSTGQWFVKGQSTTGWGASGDVPVPGDYNGDGTTDIAVYRPSTGQWWIRGQGATTWGTGTDIPVPGDYNGDGTTDIAVYRPSTGQWWIRGQGATTWGNSTDIPVPGDYNGDGTTDIAVYRPSTGQWWIKGQGVTGWGTSGDRPEPGDYDGNGTTDIAVFRPSTGHWYVKGQSGATWGQMGDFPLPLPLAAACSQSGC